MEKRIMIIASGDMMHTFKVLNYDELYSQRQFSFQNFPPSLPSQKYASQERT